MKDALDLRESYDKLAQASKLYSEALAEERDANEAYKRKKQEIKLLNMEALLSKDMTAAVHKIKVEAETFEEELALDTAKSNRKMYGVSLDSVKESHWTMKKEIGLQ